MMKRMKLALVALCLVAMLLLTGCGQKSNATSSLIGVWKLENMTGSDEAAENMAYYETLGLEMSIAISSSDMEVVTTIGDGGEYEHETVAYRIEGTKMITEASEMEYKLEGDKLYLTTDGVTMVFDRAY